MKIQNSMGQAHIQTTMRYLHYVPQDDDAARLTAAFTTESVHPSVHPNGGHHPVAGRNSAVGRAMLRSQVALRFVATFNPMCAGSIPAVGTSL